MSYEQHEPSHPGELIFRTYIAPFASVSGNLIADELGCARSTFNRLINGVSDITPQMAIRLSKVLGSSAKSWLSLQDNYDLWKAEKVVDTGNLRAMKFEGMA